MAAWRQRALELFPNLKNDLNRPDYTIYSLFFDLLSAVQQAHRQGDQDRLTAIYGFATWCARERAQPLWNAAGVAFYEHLFDEPWMRQQVPPWLPADVRAEFGGLWEARLSASDLAQVRGLLARTPPRS